MRMINMKDTHVFYGFCIIAALAIAVVGIGYATDMLPRHKQSIITTRTPSATNATQTDTEATRAAKSPTAPKKKNCGCCAERRAKYEEWLKKRHELRKAATAAQQMASE